QANQFDFERRQCCGLRACLGALERERHVAQEPVILTLGRLALAPRDVVQIDLLHNRAASLTNSIAHDKPSIDTPSGGGFGVRPATGCVATAVELSESQGGWSAGFSPLSADLGQPARGGLKSALLNSTGVGCVAPESLAGETPGR